ncbi:histidine kinase [Caulobacter sp. D4A]|uniref:sensor histidine kinase n=1 Tax=unclassified Caulobacter TaxID=2648921 RepID=UPI000D740027|nr:MULTISPECIES: histidine kinase dimerization/phosphoacceptor domain -containing protein [unclassified Caulobacter]PXA90341.1 histidine kinase [Caulobacter sp. D5]PXA95411.1 histidine kinase [Caulobacter sp. D4A]
MLDEARPVPLTIDVLAHALVGASDAPILLLDGDFRIVAASQSFAEAFDIDAERAVGLSAFALGAGEWNAPQLRDLLDAALRGGVTVEAGEMDLVRAGQEARRLVIRVRGLDYGDPSSPLLLLTVFDVTVARLADRAKDDLVREKGMLFDELQHRIANSLQIIASILMQSARKAPSTEIRAHVIDAHSRVMSVAALQRQLVESGAGQVELKAYFGTLCDGVTASMVSNPDQLKLSVVSAEQWVAAEVAVSMGLIVTELIINALKHAFPGREGGHIWVEYSTSKDDWTLSVADDGVGMPTASGPTRVGLGSSIVQALARQLQAKVGLNASGGGTRVAIVHSAAPS